VGGLGPPGLSDCPLRCTAEAFDAGAAILPGSERDLDDNGERLIWLARRGESSRRPLHSAVGDGPKQQEFGAVKQGLPIAFNTPTVVISLATLA
jgi:hypothetical protein